MFLVDGLLVQVIDYFKQTLLRRQMVEYDTMSHARKAMRKLASSLSEMIAFLERGIFQLKRTANNKVEFHRILSGLLNEQRLYENMHESGVCEDLRNAQDELSQLPESFRRGENGDNVSRLISEIDGYEWVFINAVKEFISDAQRIDLMAAQQGQMVEPQIALDALQERTDALKDVLGEIEDLLNQLRDKSITSSGR